MSGSLSLSLFTLVLLASITLSNYIYVLELSDLEYQSKRIPADFLTEYEVSILKYSIKLYEESSGNVLYQQKEVVSLSSMNGTGGHPSCLSLGNMYIGTIKYKPFIFTEIKELSKVEKITKKKEIEIGIVSISKPGTIKAKYESDQKILNFGFESFKNTIFGPTTNTYKCGADKKGIGVIIDVNFQRTRLDI